ncbi:MYRIP [Branchiostoma lanceolatum]|uniref:MYRIP protein n=1 Tax=Branchiostoma lanceolatum TaxID=7740 RepID=A0A8J9ZA56_BRALA|nr:MYRIP [Branchiostoma lanceolatum]
MKALSKDTSHPPAVNVSDFEAKVAENLKDDQGKGVVLAKPQGNSSNNDNACVRCNKTFFFLLNRKIRCADCNNYVCKDCSALDSKDNVWVCTFCQRVRELKTQSAEWFYSNIKQRFKRFGSAKVVRSLYKRKGERSGNIHVSGGTDTTKSDFTCLHGRKTTDKFSTYQKNRASNKESNGDHDSHGDHTFFTHIYDCMEGRKMPPKKADCSDHIRLAVDLTPVIYNIRRAKNEAYVIQNRLKWMQKSKSTPDLSKLGDEILFLEGFADSSTLDTRKCSHTYSRSRAHQRRRGDCPYCARVRSNSAPNVGEKEESFTGQSENLPRQKSGSQSDLRSQTRWKSEEDVDDHSKKVKTTYYKSQMKIDIGGDSTAISPSNSQENENKTVVGEGDKERKTVREELSVRLEGGEQRKTNSTSDLRYSCMVEPNDKDTVFDDVEYNYAKAESTDYNKDIDKKAKATVSRRAGLEKEEVVQQSQDLPDSSPSSSKPLSSASLLLAKTEPTSKKDDFVAKKVEMPPPKKLNLKGYYSIENLFQNRSKWLSRSQEDLLEDGSQKKLSKDFAKKSSQQFSRSQDLSDESSQKEDGNKKTSPKFSRCQEDLVDKDSQIKKFSRSEEDLLDIGTRKTFRKEKTKKSSLASPTRMRLSRSEENLISEDNSKKKPEVGPLTIDPSKFSATSVEVFREIPNVQANLVKERISLYESFVEENPSVEIRSKSLPRNMSKTGGDLRSRSLPRNVYEKFEGKTSQETVEKKPTAATRRSRGFSRRADFKKMKVPSSDQKKESRKEVYKPKVTEETPKKDVKNPSTSNDFKPSQVKQQLRNRRHGTTEQTSLESKPKVGKEEAKETKKDVQTFSASKEVKPSQVKQHTRGKSPGKTEETSSELKTNLKAVTQSLTNEIADDTVMLRKVRRSDKIPESSEGPKAVDEKQPQVKEKVEKLKYPRVEGDAFILTKIRTTQLMEDEEVDSKTKPAKNFAKGTNGLTTAVAGFALNSTEGKLVSAKPVWIDTGWPKKGELDGFYTAKYGWIEPQKPKTVQEGIFLAKMVWAGMPWRYLCYLTGVLTWNCSQDLTCTGSCTASDSDHDSTYTAPGRIGPRPRPTSPTSDAGCQTDPEFAFSDTEVQTDGLDKFAYNRRDPSSVETFKTQIETIVTAMAQPIVSAALAAERQQQSQMPQNGSSTPGVASSLGMALRVAEDVVDSAIEKAGKIARPIPTRTTTSGDGDSGVSEGSEWDSMEEQLMEELLSDMKTQCLRKLAGAIVEEMGIQTERDGPFLAPVQEEHEEEAETDGSGFRPLSDRLRRKREESVRTVELDNEPALLYEGKKRKGYVDPKKGSMLARADLDSTLASIIGEEAPEQKAEFTTEMKFTAVYKTNESAASGKDSPTGSIDRDDLLEEDQNWMIPEPKPKRLLSRKISGSMEALNSATPLDKTPYDDHDSVVSEPDEKEASDEDITAVEKESRTPTNGSLSPEEIRKSDLGEDEVQKYEQRIAKEQKLRKKRELGETKSTHVSKDLCDHDKTTALQKKVQAKSKQQNANNEESVDDFNLNKLVHIHGRLDSLDTQLKGVPPNSSRTGKTKKSPKERKPSEEGYYSAKGESISSPRSEIPEDFTDHLSKSAFDTYSKRVSQIPLSSTASSLSSASPDMDSTTPIFSDSGANSPVLCKARPHNSLSSASPDMDSSTPIFSDSGANSPGGSYSVKRKEEIEISNLSEKVSAKQEEVLESAQDILHSANQQTAARAARQVTSTVLTTLKSAEQVSQGQPDEVKTISVKRKQGSMDEAERLEEEVYLNAGKVFALQEDLRHLQSQVENIQEDTPEPQVRALEERVTRTIAQVQQSAEHVRKSQERLEEIGVGPVKIIEDRMKNVNLGSSPTSTTAPTRPVPAPRKSLQQKVAEEHNRRKSPGNSRQHSRRNSRTNLAMSPEREEEVFDRNQAYRNSITKRGGESGLKWELAQEPPQEPETERPKRLADVRRWRAKNQKAETDSSEPLNRLKSDGMTSPSVRERAAVWDQHWRQETDKQRLKKSDC